jgi:hypothetical protein
LLKLEHISQSNYILAGMEHESIAYSEEITSYGEWYTTWMRKTNADLGVEREERLAREWGYKRYSTTT